MIYGASVRTARMQAVADAMDAGGGPALLQLWTARMGEMLVSIELAQQAATVEGDELTLEGLPRNGRASTRGEPKLARIVDGSGAVVVDALTVGTRDANVIVDRGFVSPGQVVVIEAPCKIVHAHTLRLVSNGSGSGR